MEACGNRQLPAAMLVSTFLPVHLFYWTRDHYCFAWKWPQPLWTRNDVTQTYSSKVKRELIGELSPIPCSVLCSWKDKSLFQTNPDCFSNRLAFGRPGWVVLWHNPDTLPIAMKKSLLTSEVNSLNEALDFLSWKQEKLFGWGQKRLVSCENIPWGPTPVWNYTGLFFFQC